MTKQTKQAIVVSIAILLVCLITLVAAFKHQQIKWWYWWWRLNNRVDEVKQDKPVGYEAIDEIKQIVGDYTEERAVNFLIMILTDERFDVIMFTRSFASKKSHSTYVIWLRADIAQRLGRLKDKRAVEALIRVLMARGEFKDIRYHSASALGDIGDTRALDPLEKALEAEKDRDIRKAIVAAIKKLESLPEDP